MDAFEARLQFLQVIKNLHKTLNASKDTSPISSGGQQQNDPVQFYLRHYEHHYEDFQQCMLDSTQKMDSLDRLNVVIYWSRLISMLWPRCMKDVNGEQNIPGKVVYEHLLGQLSDIMLLVLPENDWKSLTNLKVCIDIFTYLNSLCGAIEDSTKISHLTQTREDFISKIDPPLATQVSEHKLEVPWYKPEKSHDWVKSFSTTLDLLIDRKKLAYYLQEYYRQNGACALKSGTNTSIILHRMENDRERHKKSKEHLWLTERDYILDTREFDLLWRSFEGMTKNDYNTVREVNKIAHSSYMYS